MAKLKTSELRQIAQELGLIENTGTRQKNNGTLSFVDPVASTENMLVSYTVHTNGYIRRNFKYRKQNWYNQNTCYQLNRQVKYNGMTQRLLATPLEQVAILYLSTVNYRKNK